MFNSKKKRLAKEENLLIEAKNTLALVQEEYDWMIGQYCIYDGRLIKIKGFKLKGNKIAVKALGIENLGTETYNVYWLIHSTHTELITKLLDGISLYQVVATDIMVFAKHEESKADKAKDIKDEDKINFSDAMDFIKEKIKDSVIPNYNKEHHVKVMMDYAKKKVSEIVDKIQKVK